MASKGMFLKPEKLEGKGKEEKKEKERGEEKKAIVVLSVFIIATLEIAFGPFGDNFFKNPARYIYL